MAANLYFLPHYITSRINLHSRNKPIMPIGNICTECMREYLHNACQTFFATTTTPHYQTLTLGHQQQTNMVAGTRKLGIHPHPHLFTHAFAQPFIYLFQLYLSESPSNELFHGKRGTLTIAVRAASRRRKAYIKWDAS